MVIRVRTPRQELAQGKFQSEADVICEGIRLLRDRERRIESLREDVRPGVEEADRGEVAPLDIEAIKREGRSRLSAR